MEKSFSGKKLLVLSGAAVHCKVVEAAKKMGVHTIVADYLPPEQSPAKQIADEHVLLSILDTDAIIAYCREHPVDGIINFCNDIAQRPHQKACEALGLPSYGTAEQYFTLTDKTAFKAMCRKYGVDVIPEYTEADIDAERVEYPVLVKPVDSRGSRGQAVCYNKVELLAALPNAKKESTNGNAIIEKYMAGKQDFTMSYVFKDGRAYLTRTADRYLGKPEDGLNKQCIGSVSPSKNTAMYLEKVHDRVVSALQKIGITNGTVFMQGFVDGDTVRFYDPGFRLPGAEYERILHQATGVNLMREMVTFALGGEISVYDGKLAQAYQLDGKVSVQLLVTARNGKIAKFEGVEEIKAHPDVVAVTQRYFPGDTIEKTGDVRQRICEICVLSPREKARSVVEWVQAKLVVEDENGENMLVSQFDSRVL